MTLLEGPINLAKIRIFNSYRIIGTNKWKVFLIDTVDSKLYRAKMILSNLQTVYIKF